MRLIGLVIWNAAGFCAGFLVGGKICEWWVLPGWEKRYPHDGQLGLGVMMYALGGGMLDTVIMLAVGIFIWIKVFPVRE